MFLGGLKSNQFYQDIVAEIKQQGGASYRTDLSGSKLVSFQQITFQRLIQEQRAEEKIDFMNYVYNSEVRY